MSASITYVRPTNPQHGIRCRMVCLHLPISGSQLLTSPASSCPRMVNTPEVAAPEQPLYVCVIHCISHSFRDMISHNVIGYRSAGQSQYNSLLLCQPDLPTIRGGHSRTTYICSWASRAINVHHACCIRTCMSQTVSTVDPVDGMHTSNMLPCRSLAAGRAYVLHTVRLRASPVCPKHGWSVFL